MDSRILPLLETVGIGCSLGIGVACVLLLDSLSVASESPSLLETVGLDCPVGIAVPCVLLLESLSVARTFPSLPGVVGSGCPPVVFDVVVLVESFSVASESPFLLESVG